MASENHSLMIHKWRILSDIHKKRYKTEGHKRKPYANFIPATEGDDISNFLAEEFCIFVLNFLFQMHEF